MHKFWTPRWILTTLLAIAGVAVLIRLGFWQLDRLTQRRAFNERVSAQIHQPALDLNTADTPDAAWWDMEYRSVVVRGRYALDQEVLLRNQVWQDQLGFHVLTPLQMEGSGQWVLVDRGWIPFTDGDAARRSQYAEGGLVTVRGMIRRPQEKPDFGGVADPTLTPQQTRLDAWNIVNLARIQQQVSGPLLPIYVQQAPEAAWTALPYRSLPEIEITEGPHLSYAIQWFIFATILGVGYPFFVRRQLREAAQTAQTILSDPETSRG